MAGTVYWTYLGIHALSLCINAAVAVWVWRRDFGRSGRYFLLAVTVGLVYGVAGTGVLAQRGTDLAPVLFPVVGVISWASGVAWFAFVLQYTGRGHLLTRRTRTALVGSVAVVGVLVLTNPLHETVYTGYEIVRSPYPHSEPVEGWLWYVLTPVGYLVSLGSIGLLVVTTLRARNVSRRLGVLFSSVFVLTVVVSIALQAEVRTIPPSISGVVFNGTLAYMLSRERMLAVEPLTRSAVMESMNDALVAVTEGELVVDYNEAAVELFPDLPDGVGDPVAETAPALAGLVEDPPDRITASTAEGERTLAVDVDPIGRQGVRGYAVILRDVTEIEAYAADLERQTEQLDQFAAVVSHDLRNPLGLARAHTEQLRHTTDGESAEVAVEALDRMEELIDQALTLARQGQVVEEPRPVAVAEPVADAWRFVDPKGAILETELGGMVVEGDPERIQTMFENLFRNAIDHGSSDVRVRVTRTPDGFRVVDDGPGFPEEALDEGLTRGFTTAEDGTGLGLSIVDSVANAHGWTVQLDNAPDGGARVTIGDVDVVDHPDENREGSGRQERVPGAADD